MIFLLDLFLISKVWSNECASLLRQRMICGAGIR